MITTLHECNGKTMSLYLICSQAKTQSILNENTESIRKLKRELNDAQALAEEKEGAAQHWKLKYEDKCREMKDQEEKFRLDLRGY